MTEIEYLPSICSSICLTRSYFEPRAKEAHTHPGEQDLTRSSGGFPDWQGIYI